FAVAGFAAVGFAVVGFAVVAGLTAFASTAARSAVDDGTAVFRVAGRTPLAGASSGVAARRAGRGGAAREVATAARSRLSNEGTSPFETFAASAPIVPYDSRRPWVFLPRITITTTPAVMPRASSTPIRIG